MTTVSILLSAFVLSVIALAVFIWSMQKGLFDTSPGAASVIFNTEAHAPEDPSAAVDPAHPQDLSRDDADESSAPVVFLLLCCAMVWLLVASLAGLTASIKLHEPDLTCRGCRSAASAPST
jgi:cytochrome c oxidase cbb3-type subunit 1